MQKGLKLITLQGAIEKSPILRNEWLDGNIMFRILVVAIIFSPTVQAFRIYVHTYYMLKLLKLYFLSYFLDFISLLKKALLKLIFPKLSKKDNFISKYCLKILIFEMCFYCFYIFFFSIWYLMVIWICNF